MATTTPNDSTTAVNICSKNVADESATSSRPIAATTINACFHTVLTVTNSGIC